MISSEFYLTPCQITMIQEWLTLENQKALEIQKSRNPTLSHPYTGAAGGMLTYSFTPTNLGVVVKVEHPLTKEILDVTDYHEW